MTGIMTTIETGFTSPFANLWQIFDKAKFLAKKMIKSCIINKFGEESCLRWAK